MGLAEKLCIKINQETNTKALFNQYYTALDQSSRSSRIVGIHQMQSRHLQTS